MASNFSDYCKENNLTNLTAGKNLFEDCFKEVTQNFTKEVDKTVLRPISDKQYSKKTLTK